MSVEDEDIPESRDRWDTEAIIREAQKIGIKSEDRKSLLEEIGKKLSSWRACFGGIAVALDSSQDENPINLIDKVKTLKKDKEELERTTRKRE